ncbi:MAG: DUF5615 family PIN-like protein [Candidatus Nanopelagicales bacterium]
MTQLLLDEMLSPKIAEALRSAGVDVVSVSAEPNLRGLADSDVLDWAASEGRVLVTDNIKDFAVLNAQWAASPRKHPGPAELAEFDLLRKAMARGRTLRLRIWSVGDHIRAKSAGTEQPPRDFGRIWSVRDHIRAKSARRGAARPGLWSDPVSA